MDIGRKNRESFWPSYVDIMTTLFAVMLILFAVSYARFKLKEGQLEMLVNEYKDIIDELGVPHSYIELSDKHTLFNFYCATQVESAKVKAIANQYEAKYFVAESKNL